MQERGSYLALDLGAESGRAVLGTVVDGRLALEVLHRFPNEPQRILNAFYWDTPRLFAEIKNGLRAAKTNLYGELHGIGVDTWGVDFGLLDRNDELLGLPRHYRDHHTDGILEKAFAMVPAEEIYRRTGIQFMQINTLFQLLAMQLRGSAILDNAASLLMTPDLLHFWLTGIKSWEYTIASTSQCFNPIAGDWDRNLLAQMGLPSNLFGPVCDPASEIGSLHTTVRRETGLGEVPVIAVATHDTASAVAAVPSEEGEGWAYISCGTWSLVGVERPTPVMDDASLRFNLTNEGGVNRTTRLLRNVMGLWLLQECRRSWKASGNLYEYAQLAAMAADSPPLQALIDPDAPEFLSPEDMPSAIVSWCRASGQRSPSDVAAVVRCIIDSLALKYRWVLERLEEVTGSRIHTVHIIGGGCQNRELCQAAADASGRRVLAGPVEATAAGNVLVQAMATGRLENLADIRAVVRASFPVEEFLPRPHADWDAAYARFVQMLRA
jgi:rhamnulokinase